MVTPRLWLIARATAFGRTMRHLATTHPKALFSSGLGLLIIVSWGIVALSDGQLWAIETVDIVVVSATIGVGLFVLLSLVAPGRSRPTRRQHGGSKVCRSRSDDRSVIEATSLASVVGASLGVILTVFVAYGALRNQSRLTAEIAIGADGGRIADWEREESDVRCLYDWFDQSAPAALPRKVAKLPMSDICLARIVANREAYTEVMLYIEEVFFILRQSQRDKQKWGSSYYAEVEYWKSDISEDFTGLFSFHLLNRYPFEESDVSEKLEAAKREMSVADVGISNICAGAQRVQVCLRAVGRLAEPLPSSCDAHIPIATDVRLLRLEAACQAEARARAEAVEASGARSVTVSLVPMASASYPLDSRKTSP